MDMDYADDIAFLASTPALAEFLLHSLEQVAGSLCLHVNVDKTECMCFNQSGDISTLNGGSLKLVEYFTYIGNSVSSTENDINTRLAKDWTSFESLSVIWKPNLSDKIKRRFFKLQSWWYCYMDASRGSWLSVLRKSLTIITQECYELYWSSPGGKTTQNSSCTATKHPSQTPSKLDEPYMRDTAGEVRMNSKAIYSCGPLHIDEQRLVDQLEPIYSSPVPIRDVAWKTWRELWTIETSAKMGQGNPC